MRRRRATLLLTGMATALLGAAAARAQNPVRLPEVKVTADADRALVGIVTDTSGIPIEGAEVTIGKLKRLVFSRTDGSFRIDSVPKGTFAVRARKIGYGPQIQEIQTDKQGGRLDNFELVPITRLLPPMVASVDRLGLSGVVADTGFRGLSGAVVKVMGIGMTATTDSGGAFYVPLIKPGTYMVSVGKASYGERLVSVSMPADSGRRITVSLGPPRPHTTREAWNIPGLGERIAWSAPGSHLMYSREYLLKSGFQWAQDAVAAAAPSFGITDTPDPDCYATLDGGPTIVKIEDVTVDEIESIEFGGRSLVRGASHPVAVGSRIAGSASRPTIRMAGYTNTERLDNANHGKRCLMVNIWSR